MFYHRRLHALILVLICLIHASMSTPSTSCRDMPVCDPKTIYFECIAQSHEKNGVSDGKNNRWVRCGFDILGGAQESQDLSKRYDMMVKVAKVYSCKMFILFDLGKTFSKDSNQSCSYFNCQRNSSSCKSAIVLRNPN